MQDYQIVDFFSQYTKSDILQHSEAHLSTAVAWREKKFQHFVFNKYFCLVLGVLKSKI